MEKKLRSTKTLADGADEDDSASAWIKKRLALSALNAARPSCGCVRMGPWPAAFSPAAPARAARWSCLSVQLC